MIPPVFHSRAALEEPWKRFILLITEQENCASPLVASKKVLNSTKCKYLGLVFFFLLLIRWSKGLRGSRDFGSMHKVNSAASNGIVRFHSSALIRISAKWSHSTERPLNWNQGRLCLLSQISAQKMRMIWKCWTHYILLVVSQKCSSQGYGF